MGYNPSLPTLGTPPAAAVRQASGGNGGGLRFMPQHEQQPTTTNYYNGGPQLKHPAPISRTDPNRADLAIAKLELENTVLKQRIASLEQQLAEVAIEVNPITITLANQDTNEGQYQQLYEQLIAALAVITPNQVPRSRIINSGSISPDQLAHKIKCKLDMLTQDNGELLQMCAALNKSSLMVEVALLRNQLLTASPSKSTDIVRTTDTPPNSTSSTTA